MKNIQSLIKTTLVVAVAVISTFFVSHSAKASDSVFFHQDASGNVTCYTTDYPQVGASCTDKLYNNNATNGESLNWTSISTSYSPGGSWLTTSPTQASNIQPGAFVPAIFTVQSGLSAGTYTATVTFNGQSATPLGNVDVPTDTVSVQYIVDPSPPGNPVGPPTAVNTGACGTIQLSWVAGTNDISYDVFRSGTKILSHYAGTAYTDSAASAGVSYTYSILAYNAGGANSATVNFSPGSIQTAPCVVDLSLSDDLISSVNLQPYPYISQCVGSQSGTAVTIQQNEPVELRIDICNRGTVTAQNVVLSSNFDTNIYHTQFACCYTTQGQTSPSGYSNTTSTGETVTWNVGSINPDSNSTVYVFLQVNAGQNAIQSLERFINSASISYTSSGGHVLPAGCVGNYADATNPCIVSTGYVPFNVGSNTTQQEIKP